MPTLKKPMDNLRSAKKAPLPPRQRARRKDAIFVFRSRRMPTESYIKIDEDILNGVPQEDWKTVVKQAIKERYPNGFERNGWTIFEP